MNTEYLIHQLGYIAAKAEFEGNTAKAKRYRDLQFRYLAKQPTARDVAAAIIDAMSREYHRRGLTVRTTVKAKL